MNKKRFRSSLICLFALAVILFWASSCHSTDSTAIDTTFTGIKFTSGTQYEACEVHIKGSLIFDSSQDQTDQFYTGTDGGIWIDGSQITSSSIGFFDPNSPYAIMTQTGDPYCELLFSKQADLLVAKVTLGQEEVLIVAPANTAEDAIRILKELDTQEDAGYYSDIYADTLASFPE